MMKKSSLKFTAAKGTEIKNFGKTLIRFKTSGHDCGMQFHVTDVNKPLAAVSAIVDQGNVVVFGKESYIENLATRIRIPMTRRNGTYEIEVEFEIDDDDDDTMETDAVTSEAAPCRRPA